MKICVRLGYGDFVGASSGRGACLSNIEGQWGKNSRQLKRQFQEEVLIERAKKCHISYTDCPPKNYNQTFSINNYQNCSLI